MRYWLHTNKKLYGKIHQICIKQIHLYYIKKAKASGIKDPTPGTISFTQRFGSALNLNLHMHVLCGDGVYTRLKEKPQWRNLDPISDEEVQRLVDTISKKVMRYLIRRGYLDSEGQIVENPLADELFTDSTCLDLATRCSLTGKIAFGPNQGKYVTRLGSGFGYGEEVPLSKGRLCASINGFSLHANTAINTYARERLEKLISYIARGPISNKRLEITDEGKVKLELKTPWSDGTTHLLFTPSEFIEKLTALIPPPKSHLVRWAGFLAPNSPYRKEITLKPEVKKGFQFKKEDEKEDGIKNYSWSKMLACVFKIDVTKCTECGGDMYAVSSIMDRDSIIRYLKHINIEYEPPPRAPPRIVQGSFGFEQIDDQYGEEPTIYLG
jgi:hypothetical protein